MLFEFFIFLSIISFILNIIHIIKYFKNITQIEDKTYNKLQNYLNTSKPDKLFKDYYDYFESDYKNPRIWNENEHKYIPSEYIDNQIITIEFNENYKAYHVGKSCMSDIINNLNYDEKFKDLMKVVEQPKLVYSEENEKWWFKTKTVNIDLSKELFKNVAINFHINYTDLNQIAKTIKHEDLYKLSNTFKNITTNKSSKYIIYDIYNNNFKEIDISNVKTWNDYINKCLYVHHNESILNEDEFIKAKGNNNICKIIDIFRSKARKYNWMFKENTLYLYNSNTNKIALPNPDGLIINRCKII